MMSHRNNWVIFSILLLATGCERKGGGTSASSAEKVTIIATVYPLADIARQVGGTHVDVSWVVEGGQSLSGMIPDEQTRNRLRTSDLVLLGGASEPWANIGMADPMQHNRSIRMDSLETNGNFPSGIGLSWLDPLAAQTLSNELCKRLRALRPQFDRDFQMQTGQFVSKIDQLYQDYRPKFDGAMTRNILVLSSDYSPLIARLGLYPVQPITASPMQLDNAAIAALKKAATENHTRLLLIPIDTPATITRDIEVRGGLQPVRIDFLGSSGSGGHDTYLEMLRYDFEQLLSATTVR